jgi:hypothetical protein
MSWKTILLCPGSWTFRLLQISPSPTPEESKELCNVLFRSDITASARPPGRRSGRPVTPLREPRQASILTGRCRGGGIGRRSGLKIRRGQTCGGSSPPLGTKKEHGFKPRLLFFLPRLPNTTRPAYLDKLEFHQSWYFRKAFIKVLNVLGGELSKFS